MLTALLGGGFYFAHHRRINGAGLLLCGACRMALIALDGSSQDSGRSGNAIFHNLLVVAFSLSANEVSCCVSCCMH